MTAEEIFNMFFGSGFPSQTVYMRRGADGAFRRQAHSHRQFNTTQQEVRDILIQYDWDSVLMKEFSL